MFGVSFTEMAVIAVVALIAVGPQRLPAALRSLGDWIRRLRQLTSEVRAQTGIDEILRAEGLEGGLSELRGMLRGDLGTLSRISREPERSPDDPYLHSDPYRASSLDPDREYPPEGPDAAGVIPDDLYDDAASPAEAGP